MFSRLLRQLRDAPKDIRASLKSIDTPKGYYRPGLYQPEIWERLHPDDVKYAAKMATKKTIDDLRCMIGMKPLYFPAKEEAGPHTAETPKTEGAPASSDQPAPKEPPRAPVVTADEIREILIKIGTRAGDAYNDPQVREKGQLLLSRASESVKEVVDEFLLGYAEGKAVEIRRALEEEVARRQQQPPPPPAENPSTAAGPEEKDTAAAAPPPPSDNPIDPGPGRPAQN